MKELVVAVSQHTVFLAESVIEGCLACTTSASIPLTRVLDRFANQPAGSAEYILPVLAVCPRCQTPLDEWALVELKD